MNEREHPDDEPELQAPTRFVDALRGLHKDRVFVPPSVTEAILREGQARLARIRQRRSRFRVAVQWSALAASIVAAALVFAVAPRTNRFAREDLNRDRRVDILDAFVLSRALKNGGAVPAAADLNGDGRVDSLDVEIIARRSVTVGKGGQS